MRPFLQSQRNSDAMAVTRGVVGLIANALLWIRRLR